MKRLSLLCGLALASAHAMAVEVTVNLSALDAQGAQTPIGSVRLVETRFGVALYPSLRGLQPGLHGFHVHENPSCGPTEADGKKVPGGAAGGHYDPEGTKKHGEPWGGGHLGDLPPLFVAADGSATTPVLAPRLKMSDVRNRSLMVHAGGDNHADHPAPLGGGGARVACGVIGA
jgi:Cu-Zn family superoxide dismutase